MRSQQRSLPRNQRPQRRQSRPAKHCGMRGWPKCAQQKLQVPGSEALAQATSRKCEVVLLLAVAVALLLLAVEMLLGMLLKMMVLLLEMLEKVQCPRGGLRLMHLSTSLWTLLFSRQTEARASSVPSMR